MANKNGDNFSLWRTSIVHENSSEYGQFEKTLDLILLYNCEMTSKHLPSMLFKRILFKSPIRQTESKAFSKSINTQYIFSYDILIFLLVYIE